MASVTTPSGRISRTGQQLATGSIGTVLISYFASLTGWDFDPLTDSKNIPDPVVVALVAGISILMSWWMNRKPNNPGAEAAKAAAKGNE